MLLSGQWAATYAELNSEHQHLADAVHSGTPDAVKEAEDTMDDVVDKVRERIEDAIEFGVQGSCALVVLLTEHVLCCPLTLLEVYAAMQRDITIVPVVVAGSNYDFAKTPAQLQRLAAHLEEELGEVLYNDVLGLLARRGISMGQMQSKLKKLPNLIAVTQWPAHPHSTRGPTPPGPNLTATQTSDPYLPRSRWRCKSSPMRMRAGWKSLHPDACKSEQRDNGPHERLLGNQGELPGHAPPFLVALASTSVYGVCRTENGNSVGLSLARSDGFLQAASLRLLSKTFDKNVTKLYPRPYLVVVGVGGPRGPR